MSDTHAPEPRYVIKPAPDAPQEYRLYLIIDTRTDLAYGAFPRPSALRIAAHLNAHEQE